MLCTMVWGWLEEIPCGPPVDLPGGRGAPPGGGLVFSGEPRPQPRGTPEDPDPRGPPGTPVGPPGVRGGFPGTRGGPPGTPGGPTATGVLWAGPSVVAEGPADQLWLTKSGHKIEDDRYKNSYLYGICKGFLYDHPDRYCLLKMHIAQIQVSWRPAGRKGGGLAGFPTATQTPPES